MMLYQLSHSTHFFLGALNTKGVVAKFLKFEQKVQRVEVTQDLPNEINKDTKLLKYFVS